MQTILNLKRRETKEEAPIKRHPKESQKQNMKFQL